MKYMTLQEYAEIKKSTIEEVVNYAASRGIALPTDADYILDQSVIKRLDPMFFFTYKYRFSLAEKSESEPASKPASQPVVESVSKPTPKKIDLDALNKAVLPPKPERKETFKQPKEKERCSRGPF